MNWTVADLCCKAGGAGMGYHLAGARVIGFDLEPQPHYPFEFIQADVLTLSPGFLRQFDLIHASPPCQFYSAMSHSRPGVAEKYPNLIGPVRDLLNEAGVPWVIENVAGAAAWMKDPLMLCAQMFRPGILLYRHRLFETGAGFTLAAPPAPPATLPGRRRECGWPHPVPASRAGHWEPGTAMSVAGHVGNVALAREVMGISWTTREELAEAIPPAYTRHVGLAWLNSLRRAA